ncbi:alpha/beta hydrolase [Halobacillus salinarum]|uniref:Alpha/beta hydrolase n=1 Tax=Halobacillus salinarum TaxID=2932257 RepID=A0ABY4EQA2_9BACI|nr:alpha/beta hydrolase [Halobacillus salinarum]UOQ46092.1 alpha/beta hydrolase [Halobacillus salinarum]
MKKLIAMEPVGTIIIVHGAFEHSGRYDQLAKQFQADGFHVIYGDLPGQGSFKGRKGHIKSFDDYIQTIKAWLFDAEENLPLFLLGHSMGGTAVIRAMEELKPSVSGVILSSPAAGLLSKASRPMEALSYVLNYLCPSLRVQRKLKPETVTTSPELIEEYKVDPLLIDRVSIRWYREFRKAIKQAFLYIDQFPDVPLLVMQAGEDLIVDRYKTLEWFHKVESKEKTYKEWLHFYHEIFNEPKRDEVYHYTLNFMQQLISKD